MSVLAKTWNSSRVTLFGGLKERAQRSQRLNVRGNLLENRPDDLLSVQLELGSLVL